MEIKCPKCESQQYYKSGKFYRKSDGKWVARFRCQKCAKSFSRASFNACYRQNKRHLNHLIFKLLCSGISQRRCALVLNINRKTVERKFRFLALQARKQQSEFLNKEKFEHICLDDLITLEHSKLKPLSISILVENKTRIILGAKVSIIPSFGHLAKISKRKYGFRRNNLEKGLDELFADLTTFVARIPTFYSDEHNLYPKIFNKYFPEHTHHSYKSIRASVAGQGEIKRSKRDPLFSINHTLAMFRANINRLFRKTWCTTKSPQRLQDHVDLYISYHNQFLLN